MFNLVLLGITTLIGGVIIGYCGAWIHDATKESQWHWSICYCYFTLLLMQTNRRYDGIIYECSC